MDPGDQTLVRWCRQRKSEGFDLLFRKYQKYVYRLCRYYTGTKEDALDLTQEVFEKAFRAIGSFDAAKPLMPWLKTIAVNTCLNFGRSQDCRVRTTSYDATPTGSDQPLSDRLVSGKPGTEDQAIAADTRRIIGAEMANLPSEERMALMLRHIEDMSYESIARIMNCPLGTIKTYIYRARKHLKEALVRQDLLELEG